MSELPSDHYNKLLQISENGEIELYPVSFKVYRHTTVPPPTKPSHLPWPLPALLSSMGLMSSPSPPQLSAPTPLLAAGAGEGTQPVIPRRVLYYQAAFNKSTTVKEVKPLSTSCSYTCISASFSGAGDGSNVSGATHKGRGSSHLQLH